MRKSQAATEYLMILSVVFVIALIVIGILGGIPSTGRGSQDKALLSKWLITEPVAIYNWRVGDDFTAIDFRNSGNDLVTLNSFKIADLDFSLDQTLAKGQTYRLKFPGAYRISDNGFEYQFTVDGINFTKRSDFNIENSIKNNAGIMEGLIGYWKFDFDYSDASQYSYDGEPINNVVLDGGYVEFDGLDSYVNYTSGPELNQSHTVSLWINPTDAVNGWGSIFVSDFHPAPGFKGIFYKEGSDAISFWDFADHLSDATIAQGVWQHFAYVADEGALTFYINGTEAGSDSGSNNVTYTLGKIGADKQTEDLEGSVDEVLAFNRSLSAEEIASLYRTGR